MQSLLEQASGWKRVTLHCLQLLSWPRLKLSCCVQTAKRGLNAKVENRGKNRSLQGGLSSYASCWVLISFSSQDFSAARVLLGEKGPPQTGNLG